jgi:hypothetical protein
MRPCTPGGGPRRNSRATDTPSSAPRRCRGSGVDPVLGPELAAHFTGERRFTGRRPAGHPHDRAGLVAVFGDDVLTLRVQVCSRDVEPLNGNDGRGASAAEGRELRHPVSVPASRVLRAEFAVAGSTPPVGTDRSIRREGSLHALLVGRAGAVRSAPSPTTTRATGLPGRPAWCWVRLGAPDRVRPRTRPRSRSARARGAVRAPAPRVRARAKRSVPPPLRRCTPR